jgi:hypothetical protein
VAIGGNQTEQFVLLALGEELHRDPVLIVTGERLGHRLLIDLGVQTIDEQPPLHPIFTLVHQVQPLRWRVGIGRRHAGGIGRSEKLGKDRDEIEEEHDDSTNHRQFVALELPPHQAPLGRHIDAGFLFRAFTRKIGDGGRRISGNIDLLELGLARHEK